MADNIIKLSTNKHIDKLRPGMSCKLVGYIDAIESVKQCNDSQLLKFVINNGAGKRVQIKCWGDDIPRVQADIIMDRVIHLENAYCGPHTKYNNGNFTGAEITINKQTILENLREFDEKNCLADEDRDTDFQLIALDQIENSILPSRFKISGYVKTKFSIINSEIVNWVKAYVSLTDGERKIDVTINSYKPDHDIAKGDKIILTGSIKNLSEE
ncbi:uncharacterized protein LOC123266995 isoform X2 [Cotesia glomerata]|uniref:uncharacterized protein LOC123266995 isoform X2 n=1 Tax=Cotesia glomerata TaxID=32391 RepID=UPI001D005853|nr:uncharacterized protein LOC123266995 isoform X2 [Cotesia glomerata]